jgi:hypothetical protein
METYEIIASNTVEYIDANNLLGAVSEYYSKFGYQKIVKIEICK